MSARLILSALGVLVVGLGAGAVAQVQNPAMYEEPTKDTAQVNEDLVPQERTWDLIEDPWVGPDNPAVIKLNPDDAMLTAFQKRRDYSTMDPEYVNPHHTGELNE